MLRSFLLAVFLGTVAFISGQKPHDYANQYPPLSPSTFQQNVRQQIPLPAVPVLVETKNLTFVLSAKDLPNKDLLDTIDPFVKVYSTNQSVIDPVKLGTTEVVDNSPDPEFATVFWFLWTRGTQQKWTFRVRDQDDFRPDDHLGEVTVDVDDYVAKGETLNVSLSDGGFLHIQKTTPTKFKLYVRNVPRSDPFNGKSDPFVKCYWSRGVKGNQVRFFTTEVVDNVENADFNQTIEFANYIRGTDLWWTFKIRDSDGLNDDDHLGEALVEVDPFVEKRQTKLFRFGNDGKATLGVVPA